MPKHADEKEIKLAYFRLAKKYHPDNNTTDNAASMFEMVTESYEVLSNKRKRKHYDELGDAGQRFGMYTINSLQQSLA